MKKLLIAMTAAAVGTCAWAAEGAGGTTPNYLNEDFSEWSLTAPWSYGTIKDGAFSALDAAGDGELTLADGKLSLNTGSKILRGALADSAVTIPDDGLFIESKVTFKDPSDTVPDLGTDGKFALFVLDNVESCETYNTKDNPNVVAPSTNLWALGGYAVTVDGNRTLETRAYKLKVLQKTQDLEQEIDSTWLADERIVAIKAYNDVLDGAAVNGGFMVLVDGKLCSVTEVHKVVNGVISYAEGDWFYTQSVPDYLGDANSAIDSTLKNRYTAANLILNKKPAAQQLASVDFQGQGVIDDVRVTEEDVGFGSDSYILKVEVDGDGITLGCDEEIVLSALNVATNITFALATGWVLDGVTGESTDKVTVAKVNDTTYAVTPKVNGATVTIKAYLPAAYVGGTAYESLAAAVSAASADSTIDLSSNVKLDSVVAITKNLTINLNGKKLSAVLSGAFTSMFKVNGNLTLTITDTANGVLEVTGGDRVLASSNRGVATVAINKGAIDAACAVGTGENTINYVITGGKFLKEANATITPAKGYEAKEENGYWVVAPVSTSNYPESDKLVDSGDATLSDDDKTAIKNTFDAIAGSALDADAAVTNYFTTVYGENAKVPVATITGAKNVGISVANNLPLMTSENAEFVAEAVAADDGNVAAFEFTLKDGNTDDAETLLLSAQTAIQKLIKVCSDLKNNSWTAPTIGTDVDATVTDGKIKVQLKSGKANFMKIQATAE